MSGYLVRGTDESSFRACGSGKVHFLGATSLGAVKVMQEYRFRASRPLRPVYFIIRARAVDTTIAIGPNRYKSVLEVADIIGGRKETPECPPPKYGSLVQ